MQRDDFGRISPPLPRRVWLWLGVSALITLHLIVVGISLISAGVFDPPLAGPLPTRLSPGQLRAPAGEIVTRPLATSLRAPFSGQLDIALSEGSGEGAYGLWLEEGNRQFGMTLSPVGYVRVWQSIAGHTQERLPWQTWPHINGGQAVNTWWLNIGLEDAALVIRLNGELLWREAGPVWCRTTTGCRLSLWVESPGDDAVIDFPGWRIYAPAPTSAP